MLPTECACRLIENTYSNWNQRIWKLVQFQQNFMPQLPNKKSQKNKENRGQKNMIVIHLLFAVRKLLPF